jgi:hypothetical protein
MTLILQGTDNSVSSPAVQGGTAGTTTGVYYPASNQLAIATNGTLALIVNTSQNVGVGTSTPTSRLEVTASGANGIVLGVDGADSTSSTRIFGKSSSSTGGIFYYENTGNPIWCVTTGSTVGSSTGSTRLTVSQYGLALGNYDAATSGTGIKFPATQNPSSDANTLDDYEEGTFTSTIYYNTTVTATTSNATTTVTGSYIKIGKLVQVNFPNIDRATTFGGSNVVIFNLSLPFTVGGYTGPGVLLGNYNLSARYVATTFSTWITFVQANSGTNLIQIGALTYNQSGGGYLTFESTASNATFGCVFIASA